MLSKAGIAARPSLFLPDGLSMEDVRAYQELSCIKGLFFVQDEASSAVWGMPGSVAKAGLASLILPPAELAKAAALHLIHSAPGGRL